MTQLTIEQTLLVIKQGDITREEVDAVVNAANSRLAGGGGVDGAIHRAGGPAIMKACREIGHCPTGEAVVTTAGDLPARYVIHTVGPVWRGGMFREADELASAYRESLGRAREFGVKTVALPAISTGAYGYPVEQAARIALKTIVHFIRQNPQVLSEVRIVLFSRPIYDAFASALEEFC